MATIADGQEKDTDTSRTRLTVCVGSSCHLKGSRRIVEQLQALIAASGLEDRIELGGAFCMGRCVNGVSLVLNGIYHSLKPEDTGAFFTENILKKMSGT